MKISFCRYHAGCMVVFLVMTKVHHVWFTPFSARNSFGIEVEDEWRFFDNDGNRLSDEEVQRNPAITPFLKLEFQKKRFAGIELDSDCFVQVKG